MKTDNVLIDPWRKNGSEIVKGLYPEPYQVIGSIYYHASTNQKEMTEEEADYNQDLIIASVNACKAINPGNPLAAAQQLFNLYEAAKEALNLFANYTEIHECVGTYEVLNNAINGALEGYFNKLQ